jgi:hypothetical protein
MNEETYVGIAKVNGGYIVETQEGRKIFTSPVKVLAEVKRQLFTILKSDTVEEVVVE